MDVDGILMKQVLVLLHGLPTYLRGRILGGHHHNAKDVSIPSLDLEDKVCLGKEGSDTSQNISPMNDSTHETLEPNSDMKKSRNRKKPSWFSDYVVSVLMKE